VCGDTDKGVMLYRLDLQVASTTTVPVRSVDWSNNPAHDVYTAVSILINDNLHTQD